MQENAGREFGRDMRDTLSRYGRDCDVRCAGNGGCPEDRLATPPYGEPGPLPARAQLPVSARQRPQVGELPPNRAGPVKHMARITE